MKSKELRLGNRVQYGTRIVKVVGISKIGYINTKPTLDGYAKEYTGIPLTDKIIERSKVKIPGIQIVEKDGGFSIQANQWIMDEENEIAFVRYVHQLQNLYFALTGQELTISNVLQPQ